MLSLLWEFLFGNIWKILFTTILCYLIVWRYRNHSYLADLDKIPGLKAKGIYRMLGHFFLVVPQRCQKRSLPPHVYDFQAIDGSFFIYERSGLTNIWQFYSPLINVFRYDTIEVLLNSTKEIKKPWVYDFLKPWIGTGLLTSEGEKWKVRRKMLTPAFHFNSLKGFLYVFNKQSKILCDILNNYTQDEYVDVLPVISRSSLDIICESILGKEMRTQTHGENVPYVKCVITLTNLMFERFMRPWLWSKSMYFLFPSAWKFFKNCKIIHAFTDEVVAERKNAILETAKLNKSVHENKTRYTQRKEKALIDLILMEHIQNNSISLEDIREEINTFTFEGYDTSSTSLGWTLWLIGLHPWVQKNIHAELDDIFGEDERDATMDDVKNMKYLECTIKESLRLYPTVTSFGRELKESLAFPGGYSAPAGTVCFVHIYRLHRNSEVFPNPEKFDPERFTPENCAARHPFAYIPFAAGPRNCIGQKFALLELKAVLSSLLRRYKVRSLDPRDKVDTVMEIVLRPIGKLRIQIRKRNEDFDFHKVYYRP